MQVYQGVVENRDDSLKLGRCQVRIMGLHTEDKVQLPTEELPWAYPMQPITSAAMSGIGSSPVGPVLGTWVLIIFRDEYQQQPVMIGTIGGIPQSKAGTLAGLDSAGDVVVRSTDDAPRGGVLVDSSGRAVITSDGTPVTVGSSESQNIQSRSADSVPVDPQAESRATLSSSDKAIPTDLPKDLQGRASSPNLAQAKLGVAAIIAACDKLGLTEKYFKAAVLGVVGGECAWIPTREGYSYKPERMQDIFKNLTAEEVNKYAYAEKKGMSREDFFSFFYGPSHRGKKFLGNKTDEDGGKFYGRGFIQLTST